jgi:hypothetical protein
MSRLARANLILLVLVLAHSADHVFNQPDRSYSSEIIVPGILGPLAVALVLTLALRRRPEAAPLSILIGLSTAAGFVLVHLVPHWSAFSDPYVDVPQLNTMSWTLVIAPILAALYVVVAAFLELRGRPASATSAAS